MLGCAIRGTSRARSLPPTGHLETSHLASAQAATQELRDRVQPAHALEAP
jgi:phage terminase Nu1 subunit (DNA packaging protein)